MLIESLSVPKLRDLSHSGDDVVALVPQRLYAVFDGATDATGTAIDGETPGRFAASAAARAMVRLAGSNARGRPTVDELLEAMNRAIAEGLADAGAADVRAGTTVALAEDLGDTLRFLIVGDSGIRINGTETFRMHKDVDLLYTAGRVAVFRRLQSAGLSGDALESTTRQLVFRGLAQPGQAVLDAADIDAVLASARAACAGRLRADALPLVDDMMLGGIAGRQHRYCNLQGHSLGHAVLNGGPRTCGPDVLAFSRPKRSVRSIELFTDGYLSCPSGTRVQDWETEFARVEAEDPSKIAAWAGVKGSSSQYFSDDRSVVTVHGPSADRPAR